MKRILVTGFEPFGGERVNPSWEAVRALPDEISGAAVRKFQIPVEYRRAEEELLRLLEAENPDLTILCGQAGGRKKISVECCAINRDHADAPDNAARCGAIGPSGPRERRRTSPICRRRPWWRRRRRRARPASRPSPRAPMCATISTTRCFRRTGADASSTCPIPPNRPRAPIGPVWRLRR